MTKKRAGKTALIGVGFLLLSFISVAIKGQPTTQLGAILSGLFTGLTALTAIILFFIAFVQIIQKTLNPKQYLRILLKIK